MLTNWFMRQQTAPDLLRDHRTGNLLRIWPTAASTGLDVLGLSTCHGNDWKKAKRSWRCEAGRTMRHDSKQTSNSAAWHKNGINVNLIGTKPLQQELIVKHWCLASIESNTCMWQNKKNKDPSYEPLTLTVVREGQVVVRGHLKVHVSHHYFLYSLSSYSVFSSTAHHSLRYTTLGFPTTASSMRLTSTHSTNDGPFLFLQDTASKTWDFPFINTRTLSIPAPYAKLLLNLMTVLPPALMSIH